MACYKCSRCDEFKDDDWNPGTEDPDNPYELMCEDCVEGDEEWTDNTKDKEISPKAS